MNYKPVMTTQEINFENVESALLNNPELPNDKNLKNSNKLIFLRKKKYLLFSLPVLIVLLVVFYHKKPPYLIPNQDYALYHTKFSSAVRFSFKL